MGVAAVTLGSIGGLSAIYGILIGLDALPRSAEVSGVDWTFWMAIAGILLLATIALLVGRGGGAGGNEYD